MGQNSAWLIHESYECPSVSSEKCERALLSGIQSDRLDKTSMTGRPIRLESSK